MRALRGKADAYHGWKNLKSANFMTVPELRGMMDAYHGWERIESDKIIPVSLCPTPARRRMNSSRSVSSGKIFRRSMPRQMMWCSAPGASMRALRGMMDAYHGWERMESEKFIPVPITRTRSIQKKGQT
jgi:hypothetical protein